MFSRTTISPKTSKTREGKILEKPSSPEHAVEMLSELSGRSHDVFTAVVLFLKNSDGKAEPRIEKFVEKTEVFFSELSQDMIKAYVNTGSPMYVY